MFKINSSKIFYLFALSLLISCAQTNDKLEAALKLSGTNRPELEKVIRHFSREASDSLKLRSAIFLIENMPGHYYNVSKDAEEYFNRIKPILRLKLPDDDKKPLLLAERAKTTVSDLHEVEEIHIISSEFLIRHIDNAVDMWTKYGRAPHLSFDEFCEYILPHRVRHEILDVPTDTLRLIFDRGLKLFDTVDNHAHSSFWVCSHVNSIIKEDLVYKNDEQIPIPQIISLRKVTTCKWGSCLEFVVMGTHIMRTKGIPTAVDFTLEYPFRDIVHSWNVVPGNSGINHKFTTASVLPGYRQHDDEMRVTKVFRNTYAANEETRRFLRENSDAPDFSEREFARDVTPEYSKVSDVEIKIDPRKRITGQQYAYLAVFNSLEWRPIEWSRIKSNTAVFRNMGRNMLYLPVYWIDGECVPCGEPFILDLYGHINPLVADLHSSVKVKITRKYPLGDKVFGMVRSSVDAQIHAANRPDFSDADTIITMSEWKIASSIFTVETDKKYRYWRYYSGPFGYCTVAEISFIDAESKKLSGKFIGSELPGDSVAMKAAFDGDPLTFYRTTKGYHSWMGLDFGRPVAISAIPFTPRSDDNSIRPGDEYELMYWNDGDFVSLGEQTGREAYLEYEVPANALLWLRNLTRGREERPFTVVNGKQWWW